MESFPRERRLVRNIDMHSEIIEKRLRYASYTLSACIFIPLAIFFIEDFFVDNVHSHYFENIINVVFESSVFFLGAPRLINILLSRLSLPTFFTREYLQQLSDFCWELGEERDLTECSWHQLHLYLESKKQHLQSLISEARLLQEVRVGEAPDEGVAASTRPLGALELSNIRVNRPSDGYRPAGTADSPHPPQGESTASSFVITMMS